MKIHRPVIKKLYLGRSGVISTICTMAHTSKISLAIICANRNTRIYTFNSDWLFSVDYFTKREYRFRSQTSDNIWVTDFQQPPFVRSWFVFGCVCVGVASLSDRIVFLPARCHHRILSLLSNVGLTTSTIFQMFVRNPQSLIKIWNVPCVYLFGLLVLDLFFLIFCLVFPENCKTMNEG